jgi:energy-coupling factor transport system ATP-binding protein
VIEFDRVSFRYDGADRDALHEVDLRIDEGELVLVVGRTGTGKTTLLRVVNGLVPHFSGGTLTGRVTVFGRDTRTSPPRELADVVGFVDQRPESSFVTDVVEDELAYAMENLGVPAAVMRRRVEETLDLLGLAELRHRPLTTLSGGEQQRVAIGAVLTAHPRALVLDEPTSALDPAAAEEVLAALQRLVHDVGLTVLLAEHRLERVVQYADRVLTLDGSGRVAAATPDEAMSKSDVAPPVVELGRVAGWDPPPLSVRDARRRAGPLREQLAASSPAHPQEPAGALVARIDGATLRYGELVALRDATLDLRRGEVVALMGRNGAGKSSLLSLLAGLRRPDTGTVLVEGEVPGERGRRQATRVVGLVPQDPALLLYAETVSAECDLADREGDLPRGTTSAMLHRLTGEPSLDPDRHPRDLSEGQRLTLALAVVLAPEPPLLLLDEPTRGLDYAAKRRLVQMLQRLTEEGHAVLLASHDVELVAEVATRVVVLADGDVVADGPTTEVVLGSPLFAPQVAKVLAPAPWLTVADVARALAELSA